ncbi:O-antigen ligase family protein [Chlorobium sp. N1]|uniref:O-antigen ligase family protein n=1 Tax=Chlorobium sp. N1 TaxID=2491138 RepID=UPI00103A1CCA|nr:O-antigen ligase family protein [Chlorobium sp. N1]TCD48931.1 O-antigen ligase family protein [Chlorobium sp. N1]
MDPIQPPAPRGAFKTGLRTLTSLLLVPYAFILPMWIAPTYILAGLIFFLWLVGADFRSDFEKVRNNRVVWALLAFWLLNIVGLLWTEDMAGGWHTFSRASLFLLVPVFMMVLKCEHVEAVLWSFLASMLLSCTISFLMYFRVSPSLFSSFTVGNGDPTAFMSHIHYPIYLSAACAVSLYYVLFDPAAGRWKKTLAGVLALLFAADIFISNGRAGQLMFLVLIVVVIFQYYRERLLQAAVSVLIGIPILFTLVYNGVPDFRQRVDSGISDIQLHNSAEYTSVGARVVYALNGLTVFAEHPLIGVGTGDFVAELEKVHRRDTPEYLFDIDVHNSYVLKMAQFGVLGLIAVFAIYFSQIRSALRSSVPLQHYLGLSIPIMFVAILWSDVYIELHFSLMLFIFLSAIIYREPA